mmetsp:Transcript_30508/g.90468  ORF Transcript_30508/g.90468 Transcript_30508/m.90468 type:complete len:240 (+) Transcript_30508:3-722(+)
MPHPLWQVAASQAPGRRLHERCHRVQRHPRCWPHAALRAQPAAWTAAQSRWTHVRCQQRPDSSQGPCQLRSLWTVPPQLLLLLPRCRCFSTQALQGQLQVVAWAACLPCLPVGACSRDRREPAYHQQSGWAAARRTAWMAVHLAGDLDPLSRSAGRPSLEAPCCPAPLHFLYLSGPLPSPWRSQLHAATPWTCMHAAQQAAICTELVHMRPAAVLDGAICVCGARSLEQAWPQPSALNR